MFENLILAVTAASERGLNKTNCRYPATPAIEVAIPHIYASVKLHVTVKTKPAANKKIMVHKYSQAHLIVNETLYCETVFLSNNTSKSINWVCSIYAMKLMMRIDHNSF